MFDIAKYQQLLPAGQVYTEAAVRQAIEMSGGIVGKESRHTSGNRFLEVLDGLNNVVDCVYLGNKS